MKYTLCSICVCVWGCSCECTATQSMRAGFELWVRQAKVTSPRQDGGYGGGLQWSHDAISQCVFVCVCTNVCVCVMSPAQLCQSEKGPPGTAGKAGTLTETQGHQALNAHSAHKDPVELPVTRHCAQNIGEMQIKIFYWRLLWSANSNSESHNSTHTQSALKRTAPYQSWNEYYVI